jgi:hypothetical protein
MVAHCSTALRGKQILIGLPCNIRTYTLAELSHAINAHKVTRFDFGRLERLLRI